MNFSMRFRFVLVFFTFWMLLGGCQAETSGTDVANIEATVIIPEPQAVVPTPVTPGAEVPVKIDILTGNSVSYLWFVEEGGGSGAIIRDQTSSAAIWKAPDTAGTYNIFVTVTIDGVKYDRSIAIAVKDSATNTPSSPNITPTIENTPTPETAVSPTSTPTTEPSPTPEPTPTITPEPDALVTITNLLDNDTVAQSTTIMGTYSAELENPFWVFVAPHAVAKIWPQSPDACEGESVYTQQGLWEVRAGIGGPDSTGEFFDILIVIADEAASTEISQTLEQWCRVNSYPGLDELPAGAELYKTITVRRSAATSGLRPAFVYEAHYPGNVIFDEIIPASTNDPSLYSVSGTFSDIEEAHLWVLVYTPDGRFYPQTLDACGENHIASTEDGHWQVRAKLGNVQDAGRDFEVLAVLVDEEIHQVFLDYLATECETLSFKGFLSIELSGGVDVKASETIRRE